MVRFSASMLMEFLHIDDHWRTAAGIAQGGHSAVTHCSGGSPLSRTPSSDNLYKRFDSDYPLPIQVTLEDKDVQIVTELSIIEYQRRKISCDSISKQNESDFQRVLSKSKLDNTVLDGYELVSNVEEERLLKSSYEQFLMDEQRRQERTDKEYEEELKLAMDLSTHETLKPTYAEDDLQRALVESRAMAEGEQATYSIDDLVEKAVAESILLEETRKLYLHEQEKLAASCEVDLLEKVKQLSLKQHHEAVIFEEETLDKIIEQSKQHYEHNLENTHLFQVHPSFD